jgi:hypothetical protein
MKATLTILLSFVSSKHLKINSFYTYDEDDQRIFEYFTEILNIKRKIYILLVLIKYGRGENFF